MSQPSKLLKIFERKEGKTKVYENGFVESSIYDDAYIEVPYLVEGKKQLIETGIKKFYVLSEGMGFFQISKEARELSASKEYADHLAAVAMVTNNSATALVVDLYNKLNKPVVPTKAFKNRDDARNWLFEQMES